MDFSFQRSSKFGVINSRSLYESQKLNLILILGQFGYDPKLETCSILPDENGRSSKTALFVIAFFIPCLVIVVCYARIFWVVHK